MLKVRVRAAASEGEANAALIKVVAKALDVAPREVSLVAGATARLKRLKIAGTGRDLGGGAGENLRHRVMRSAAQRASA